ncbi:MAG: transglycosylase SLT domain-containing protein [Desulfobacterales bacterium]|nr:MAG: transglycosylase SLT domain-containing protein [Desulfobacterales bacterium]
MECFIGDKSTNSYRDQTVTIRKLFLLVFALFLLTHNVGAHDREDRRIAATPGLRATIAGETPFGATAKAAFGADHRPVIFPTVEALMAETRSAECGPTSRLPADSASAAGWLADGSPQPNDAPVSISDRFCRVDAGYSIADLQVLIPQLSRISEAHTDDLPDMLTRKTVRVLTTYSMTNYFISKGRSYGFEYSLLKDYERFLNRGKTRRALQTVLEFFPVPEKLLLPCLLNGLGDIVAAGLTVTPEHASTIDFTIPYLEGVHEVLVGHKNIGRINDIKKLAGRQIFVKPFRNYFESLARLNEQLTARGLPPVRIIKADEYLTTEDIFELINAGIVELSVAEKHLVDLWSGVLPNLKVYDQLPLRENASVAMIVRQNNPLLKASLNKFIRSRKKGTLHGNIYYRRYFQNTRWIKNPLNPTDRAKFSKFTPLFQKYGERYGIDWKLIAALSYQESQMDPNRRSHAGAVGLLQVRPTTAQDKRIRIRDIHQPENNIHAGTKYLALLRDTYFDDMKQDPAAQIRYALAAYNAGPRKIARCRQLAAEMGFNPNLWFRHGELAALKHIGPEPVRFVSNINKYYLAYTLSDTLDCLKTPHVRALKAKAQYLSDRTLK